jgi:hypothetical protein
MNSILSWGRSSKKRGKQESQAPTVATSQQLILNALSDKIKQRDQYQQALSQLDREISDIYRSLSSTLATADGTIPILHGNSESTLASSDLMGSNHSQQQPRFPFDPLLMAQPSMDSLIFSAAATATTILPAADLQIAENLHAGIDPNILNDPELLASILNDDYFPVMDGGESENEDEAPTMDNDDGLVSRQETNSSGGNVGIFTPITAAKRERKKRGPYQKRKNVDRQCSRCGTRESPVWRCKRTGSIMCNACGLWMKSHSINGCTASNPAVQETI